MPGETVNIIEINRRKAMFACSISQSEIKGFQFLCWVFAAIEVKEVKLVDYSFSDEELSLNITFLYFQDVYTSSSWIKPVETGIL